MKSRCAAVSILWSAVPLFLLFAAAGGCGSSVEPEALSKMSTALHDARQQSQIAFGALNEGARDSSVAFAVTQQGLKEEDFSAGVSASAAIAWDEDLARLENYFEALRTLISPDRGREFEASVVEFGKQLKQTSSAMHFDQDEANFSTSTVSVDSTDRARTEAGIATAWSRLGSLLLEAQAQHDALAVMRKTDTAFRAIMICMAHAIGDSQKSGLRGTLYADWRARSNHLQEAFKSAPDVEGRTAAALRFRDSLQDRNSRDELLVSLRASLLLLADAHSAAARGADDDLTGLASRVTSELELTRKLYDQFLVISKERESSGQIAKQ